MIRVRCPQCRQFDTLQEVTRKETVKHLCTLQSEPSLFVFSRAASVEIQKFTRCRACDWTIEGRPVASHVIVEDTGQ